jgi:hypothetical protein
MVKYNTNPSFADLKQVFDNFYNNATINDEHAVKSGYKSVRGARWAKTYDLNHTSEIPANPETFMNNPRKYDWVGIDNGSKISKKKGNPAALVKARANRKVPKKTTAQKPAPAHHRDIYLQLDVQHDDNGNKYIIFYLPDGSGNNYMTWDTYINPDYDEDAITPEYLNDFFDEIIDPNQPIANMQSASFAKPSPSLLPINDKLSNVMKYIESIYSTYG